MDIQINKKYQFCEEKAVFCFSNLLGTIAEIAGDRYWNWSRLEPVNIFTCANHRVEYQESTANGDPFENYLCKTITKLTRLCHL